MTALWSSHASRILAYASRQVDAHTAQEIVAETFVVAWRRIDEVPDDPLPWLLVVARNTISNHVRSIARRRSLEVQIAQLVRVMPSHESSEATAAERDAVVRGLRGLSEGDREVLLLAGWDGLTAEEGAVVLGCSPATFRARLSRARRRFERAAQEQPEMPSSNRSIGRSRRTR